MLFRKNSLFERKLVRNLQYTLDVESFLDRNFHRFCLNPQKFMSGKNFNLGRKMFHNWHFKQNFSLNKQKMECLGLEAPAGIQPASPA